VRVSPQMLCPLACSVLAQLVFSPLLGLLVGMLEWIVYSGTFVLVCAALATCAFWAYRS
jgi:hypothetical protein